MIASIMPFSLSEEIDNNILYKISYYNWLGSLPKISLIYLKSHHIRKGLSNNSIKIVHHSETINKINKINCHLFQDKYKPWMQCHIKIIPIEDKTEELSLWEDVLVLILHFCLFKNILNSSSSIYLKIRTLKNL